MKKDKVRFVIASFLNDERNRFNQLNCCIWSLLAQTYKNIEIYVHHDGPVEDKSVRSKIENISPLVKFIETPQRKGNWGHYDRRDVALIQPHAEWVVFTNDDNYYVPDFTYNFLELLHNANSEMWWCNFLLNGIGYQVVDSNIEVNRIDMGAFMSSTRIIAETPWTSFAPEADGIYAVDLCRKTRAVKAGGVLFVHN